MNNLVRVDQIQGVMMSMSQEMMRAGIIEGLFGSWLGAPFRENDDDHCRVEWVREARRRTCHWHSFSTPPPLFRFSSQTVFQFGRCRDD